MHTQKKLREKERKGTVRKLFRHFDQREKSPNRGASNCRSFDLVRFLPALRCGRNDNSHLRLLFADYSKPNGIPPALAFWQVLRELIRNVWQQRHKPGAFNRNRNGMLTDRGATAFSAAQNFALPTGQFFEQFDIFIIDEHRTGTLPVYHQRVFFLDLNPCFCAFSLLKLGLFGQSGHC